MYPAKTIARNIPTEPLVQESDTPNFEPSIKKYLMPNRQTAKRPPVTIVSRPQIKKSACICVLIWGEVNQTLIDSQQPKK